MKVVFVSGPYRSNTEWGLVENIRRAEAVAVELWRKGFAVICPHKNTAHFGGLADVSVWLAGDLAMLERCDAVYAMQGWKDSVGATGEVEHATLRGIPIFDSMEDISIWASQV